MTCAACTYFLQLLLQPALLSLTLLQLGGHLDSGTVESLQLDLSFSHGAWAVGHSRGCHVICYQLLQPERSDRYGTTHC